MWKRAFPVVVIKQRPIFASEISILNPAMATTVESHYDTENFVSAASFSPLKAYFFLSKPFYYDTLLLG